MSATASAVDHDRPTPEFLGVAPSAVENAIRLLEPTVRLEADAT
jgi:hypothetical protein